MILLLEALLFNPTSFWVLIMGTLLFLTRKALR
jgi:hypothetical protein